MPPSPRHPERLHREVFRGSAMMAAGVLTPNELRSAAWRRLLHDVHVCSCVRVTHAVRATAASGKLLPGSVISGSSAAVSWGVDAAADAVTVRRGVRVTTPVTTAPDLARDLPLDDAVVLPDQVTVRRAVDLPTVRAASAALTGAGCRRVRRAVAQADGLAGSPQETRLRLLLVILVTAEDLARPVELVLRIGVALAAR